MTFRKVLAGLSMCGLAMGAAMPASAKVEWTGTLAVTNDYKFRGISQSDSDPAVQGSLEVSHSGFFAGAWASSIDFATIDPGVDVEVDLYAGYTHEFNDNTSLTGKVIFYWYPGANTNDANFVEFAAALEHNFGKFSGTVQVAHTPDYFGGADAATWLSGGVVVPISDWLSVSGNVGYQWFDDNAFVGLNDYAHGDIGVTASWEIFALDLRYVMTDIENTDCVFNKWCESKFLVTLSLTKGSEE